MGVAMTVIQIRARGHEMSAVMEWVVRCDFPVMNHANDDVSRDRDCEMSTMAAMFAGVEASGLRWADSIACTINYGDFFILHSP